MIELEFAQQHPWTAALIVVVLGALVMAMNWGLQPPPAPPPKDWDW